MTNCNVIGGDIKSSDDEVSKCRYCGQEFQKTIKGWEFQLKMHEMYNCDENPNKKSHDPVEAPKHYNQGNIQPIVFIEDQKFGFALGNAVKYIVRARHKGQFKQDLKKAIWYINRAITQDENL